jgi:hypothetical protein
VIPLIFVESRMAQQDDRAISQEVDRRLREIQLQEQQARDQGRRFAFLPEEQIRSRVRDLPSSRPYFLGFGWYTPVPRGQAGGVAATVANPYAVEVGALYISLFVDGIANFLGDIGTGHAGRNLEWPFLSSPEINVAGGGTSVQDFSFDVPTDITPGTYICNLVLWAGFRWGQGTYLDRGFVDIAVT